MVPIVYLAASWKSQARMRGVRDWLEKDFGYKVQARWLDQQDQGIDTDLINKNPERAAECATADISDIVTADTVVLFTDEPSTTGGRHVELGLGIAFGKHIVIVGPLENIFQAVIGITHLPDFPAFTNYVRRLNAAKERHPATNSKAEQGVTGSS